MLRTSYGHDAQEGWMQSLLWKEDDVGKYDSVSTVRAEGGADTVNNGAKFRRSFFKDKTAKPQFAT